MSEPGGLYDEILYGDLTFFYTHPNHLAAVAALCGLAPPPVAGCRVLELGCGTGFNLLAMSHSLSNARLVGVDLSAKQIQHGTEAVAALGVTNVDLRAGRLEEVDATFGEFDFIIAHGVFSWVPADVQQALLRVVRDRLAPQGIAFVSYNTLPGWSTRGTFRDLLLLFAPADAPPAERVRRAKEAAGQFIASLPADGTHYADTLQADLAALADQPDYYVLAEHLASFNRPLYFTDFAALLADHGLQHVSDSEYYKNSFVQPGEERAALTAAGKDFVRVEQLLDFRQQRDFRQSLICHASRSVPRAVDPALVLPLWLHPRVKFEPSADADAPLDTVRRGEGEPAFPVHDPLFRRILQRVHAAPGRKLRVEAFLPDLADLDLPFGLAIAPSLLASAVSQGAAADLWTLFAAEPSFATAPGERPRACPFARREATVNPGVTNRFHLMSKLTGRDRDVFLRLDGRSTRDELAESLGLGRAELDQCLARLATAAVLEG
ncbi:methyltransferase domain-containing protein [Limnoglobus roseus]|uniref:Methyltransferase domain-containing protein n=1 Tax=Limnoglobus roseus TaxID=2598579 RepID=A0A5C1ABE5_9BACT|nr:class I SAM-dependent methyltransferase [Limnoglobus roseus]QEL14454.1 methyltransferase domain-containing protein [Limnoglobus roseus]